MSRRFVVSRGLSVGVAAAALFFGSLATAFGETLRFPSVDPVRDVLASDSILTAFSKTLDPGDTVLVSPGRTAVARDFPAGLTWIGDGPADSVILVGYIPSAPIFLFRAGPETTRVERLTFDLSEMPEATGLYFQKGNLIVQDNVFLGGYAIRADSCGGVIRRNRFGEISSAIRCEMSTFWVDQNEILGARNGAISMRGSPLRITRNRIVGNVNTGIVIVGKRFVPVIGGEPGMGNELHDGMNSVVYNHSSKEVNAQYNYWGLASTEEMNTMGYPANIRAILDGWEQERSAGRVDYRNWLDGPNGRPVRPTNLLARRPVQFALGGALIVVIMAAARRRRARRATA